MDYCVHVACNLYILIVDVLTRYERERKQYTMTFYTYRRFVWIKCIHTSDATWFKFGGSNYVLPIPCTECAAAHADRCLTLHTPCSHCAAAHADRCLPLHTPCTYCAAARADRCLHLHTPCSHCAAAHAGRCLPLHTPCTYCVSARADRC